MTGYMKRHGKQILDIHGQPILLKGWGLGNWLCPEGYMFLNASPRFDRYNRMRQVTDELCGKQFSAYFWQEWIHRYITREDLLYIRHLGYNSVRVPFIWRFFLSDDRCPTLLQEGLRALDFVVHTCSELGLYVILDMHGAPGGQTGSNIDDCIDDVPRLFMDEDNYRRAIFLWEELARRYRDEPFVACYDLLNEPIAPPMNGKDHEYLLPRLRQFYRDCTAAIRRIDPHHMISYEGHHWASDPSVFDQLYDENCVIHFHRYATVPDIACFQSFINVAQRWNLPLWLGETGENYNYWYAAMYPLSLRLNVGYNLWPYKKMDCTNSPVSIRPPQGWQDVLAYLQGGPHPGYERCIAIFTQLLENIRLENCDLHPEVTHHVMRCHTFEMRASDFDIDGYTTGLTAHNEYGYRNETGFTLIPTRPEGEPRFTFDCQCDRFDLLLPQGTHVRYTIGQTQRIRFTGQGSLLVNGTPLQAGQWLQTNGETVFTVQAVSNAQLSTLQAEG